MKTARQLLIALFALQQKYISLEELISCVIVWAGEKSKSLETFLVEHGALSSSRQKTLSNLVDERLQDVVEEVRKEETQRGELDTEADPFRTVPLPERRVEAGRFRFLRHLEKGVGGLGRVSVALDEELKREVAFKEIRPEHQQNEDVIKQFEREARITGRLEHPNIVPVYGFGMNSAGKPFYAMRFVKGKSLMEWLTEFHAKKKELTSTNKSLALRDFCARFISVCHAVNYAHLRGVLHRDLKPHNIMLEDHKQTFVVDWGMANTMSDLPTEARGKEPAHSKVFLSKAIDVSIEGSAKGTPMYMSPEQTEGRLKDLTPATDIYSLGVTLFHCLAGAPPFDPKDIAYQVTKGVFKRPRELETSIPRPLEAICLKAMQLNPQERYATTVEMAEDIERYLADEPIRIHGETYGEILGRWLRKHKAATLTTISALTVAVLVLAVGIGMVTQQWAKNVALAKANELLAVQQRTLAETNFDLANKEASQRKAKTLLAEQMTVLASDREKDLKKQRELSQQLEKQLKENERTSAALRLESATLAFEHGLKESHTRNAATRFQRAIALSMEKPDLQRSFERISLDRMTAKGSSIAPPLRSEKGIVEFAFHPRGGQMVTASADHRLQLWDAWSGMPTGSPMQSEGKLLQLGYSSDGGQVIGVYEQAGTRLQVWDTVSSAAIGAPIPTLPVWKLLPLGPGQERLATTSDNAVQLWDLATGKLAQEFPLSAAPVWIDFSPSAQCLFVLQQNGQLLTWHGTDFATATKYEGAIVRDIAFRPRSSQFVTRAEDGTIQLGTVGQAKSDGAAVDIPEKVLSLLKFSDDGRFCAIQGTDNLFILNLVKRTVVKIEPTISKELKWASFLPEGSEFAIHWANSIALFDCDTGRYVGGTSIRAREVFGLSPGGDRLGVISDDGGIYLPSTSNLGLKVDPIRFTDDWAISSASFSPDGRFVVGKSFAGSAQIWEGATGKPIGDEMTHLGNHRVQFSTDGLQIAAVTKDQTVRLFSIGKALRSPTKLVHDGVVDFFAFTANQDQLLTHASDRIRIWNLHSGELVREERIQFESMATTPDAKWYAPGGLRVAAETPEGTQLWVDKSEPRTHYPAKNTQHASYAAFSGDGKWIAIGLMGGKTAVLWDIESRKFIGEPIGFWMPKLLESPGCSACAAPSPASEKPKPAAEEAGVKLSNTNITPISISPNNEYVAAVASETTAQIWKLTDGKFVAVGSPLQHNGTVLSVVFSPNGEVVVTTSTDGTSRIWRTASGAAVNEPMFHGSTVYFAAFSADSKRLATASADSSLRIWDIGTGQLVSGPMESKAAINSIAFSPDGMKLAAAADCSAAFMWDVETGRQIESEFRHEKGSRCGHGLVGFHPSGKYLVTAFSDNVACVWDISASPHPANLVAWREITTGSRAGEKGDLTELSEAEQAEDWKMLKQDEKWLAETMAFRHFNRVNLIADAEREKHWFSAKFHLQQWKESGASDPNLQRRLTIAEKRLPSWKLEYDARQAEQKRDWPGSYSILKRLAEIDSQDHDLAERLARIRMKAFGEPSAFKKLRNETTQGYSRLAFRQIFLPPGEYYFGCSYRSPTRFDKSDSVPELWGAGVEQLKRTEERYEELENGWYRYDCKLRVEKGGVVRLALAIFQRPWIDFADITLRTLEGKELLVDEHFGETIGGKSAWGAMDGKVTTHAGVDTSGYPPLSPYPRSKDSIDVPPPPVAPAPAPAPAAPAPTPAPAA